MKKIDQETQEKIQQLQIFEQNLQNFLLQKQAFHMELSETENSLKEIENTKDDVYKLVGQVMIKASRQELEKDFKQKIDLLNLRMKSIDKQENRLKEEIEKLREEVMKRIK